MSWDSEKPEGDYEVGYKKPPKHTQFKPGESGRSRKRTRPKVKPMMMPKTLNEVVREAASRKVKLKDGDKVREVPLSDVVVRRILENGISSKNPRDARLALELLTKANAFGEREPTMDEIARSLTPAERRLIESVREDFGQYFLEPEVGDPDPSDRERG